MLADTVSVIDGATNTVIGTIQLGGGFQDLVEVGVNPTTNRIYVAETVKGVVSVIDGATNSLLTTIAGISRAQHVAVDPITNRIYLADFGNSVVVVIDGTTNTIIAGTNAGNNPLGIAINPTSNRVYVAVPGANIVSDNGTVPRSMARLTACLDLGSKSALHQ
jgi:YVTN family beta-propeller protein